MASQQADTTQELTTLEGAVCDWIRTGGAARNPFEDRIDDAGARVRRLAKQLGARYAECTFTNFEVYEPSKMRPVLERLRRFAETMPETLSAGGGLILLGRPGTGKDHLLAALLKIAVAKHKLSVEWRDGLALFEEARYAIRTDSERELIRTLVAPHIFAISDPQPPKGDLTDGQLRLIRDVIDRRYRRRVSTWMTTNIDRQEDAEALFSAPVLERIKEASVQAFCDWASQRPRVLTPSITGAANGGY